MAQSKKTQDEELTQQAAERVAGSDFSAMSEEIGDVYVHRFSEPITYEGETYTELTFDFKSLKGRDARAVANELRAINHPVLVRTLDEEYLIRMCARACRERVYFGIFDEMSIKDYNQITNVSKRFF